MTDDDFWWQYGLILLGVVVAVVPWIVGCLFMLSEIQKHLRWV